MNGYDNVTARSPERELDNGNTYYRSRTKVTSALHGNDDMVDATRGKAVLKGSAPYHVDRRPT